MIERRKVNSEPAAETSPASVADERVWLSFSAGLGAVAPTPRDAGRAGEWVPVSAKAADLSPSRSRECPAGLAKDG